MTTEIQTETTETSTTRGGVYVIDRSRPKLRAGQGLLTGLDVVFRHFRDALTRKLEKPSQQTGVFTVQYPEERLKLPEAFRNFPILLYDDETGQELCTSCFQCQRICPPQVIHMTQARDPATGKAVPAVAEFLIEYDACMSCGLCAEVCPFDAIKMDHEFEYSTDVHGGLTINKVALNRPISYYEKIAPTFWAEVKDSAMKKLQGNIKRRPDLIGVAPQMVEKIKAKRAESAAAQAPASASAMPAAAPDDKTARLAAARARAAEKTAAEAPVEPAGDSAPTDKAARLAAIRAANAAKKADKGATDAAAPATDSAPTDKAARLAAIRAANAAKKTDEGATDAAAPATDSAPTDKAARLAAIRAANAAKKAAEGAPAVPSAAEGASDVANTDVSSVPPAAEAADPTTAGAPPAGAMPADKAARLAAIRAANAAKKAAAQDGSEE